MNLKSNILKIGVVIALIIMLIPVIAAEDVDNTDLSVDVDDADAISEDVSDDDADDESDEEIDDEDDDEELDDEEIDDEDDDISFKNDLILAYADADPDEGVADLQISVLTPKGPIQAGDLAKFGIVVYNNGPDTASNVQVAAKFISGDVMILGTQATQGDFIGIINGVMYWVVGDLPAGQAACLFILGKALSNEDILLEAMVFSDTYDPDLSNNVDFGFIQVGELDSAVEAASELPATGNPIAMALLALLSVVGLSFRRKF